MCQFKVLKNSQKILNSIANYFSPLHVICYNAYDGGFLSGRNQVTFLNMLKVERNFSAHTLKSYHDDLVQFNHF